MSAIKNVLSGLIISIFFYSIVFAGWPQVWQITMTSKSNFSADGNLGRAAFIRNPSGFTFLVEKDKDRAVAHLHIPLLYSLNFSTEKSYIIVQVDDYPVRKFDCQYTTTHNTEERTFRAHGIIFYPSNDFFGELMNGNHLGIKYYNTTGWSEYFYFTLNGSSKVLSEILGKQCNSDFPPKNQTTNSNSKNENKWKIKLHTDNLGNTYKIAQTRNDKNFVLSIENGFYILGTIDIADSYPNVRSGEDIVEFQIDNLTTKNVKAELYQNGRQIVINLDKEVANLKKSHIFRCNYHSSQGKISVEFTLNGFTDAFSKI